MLENETLVDTILPNMIDAATEIAAQLGGLEIASGLERMSTTLNHEIGRLASLHKKNKSIRPEEIYIAVEEQANLTELIKDARIRLDALQLIRKG